MLVLRVVFAIRTAGAEESGRVAGHDMTGGDVFGDHGAGANQRSRADGDTAQNGCPAADRCTSAHAGGDHFPISFSLRQPIRCRSRVRIVDEHDPMTHEDFVLDRDAFADEGMAGDFAAGADDRVLLNLHKRADATLVADPAAVEINETMDRDVFSQPNVGRDPQSVHRIHSLLGNHEYFH